MLADMKLLQFMRAASDIQAWLLHVGATPVEPHIAKRVSIWVVSSGFVSWEHLDGLDFSDVASSSLQVVQPF